MTLTRLVALVAFVALHAGFALAGEVVLYSSNSVEAINAVSEEFTKKNPGIKIKASWYEKNALYAALKEKRIRGATLDVWYAYPRHGDLTVAPSKHPFHELDNVWMTPHIAAWTTGMVERRWSEIARNLDSLARGEPLLHQLR